jgi:hypothetical protein
MPPTTDRKTNWVWNCKSATPVQTHRPEVQVAAHDVDVEHVVDDRVVNELTM